MCSSNFSLMGLGTLHVSHGPSLKWNKRPQIKLSRICNLHGMHEFNEKPQNSKVHNLLILLNFDTNEHNLERYWKDILCLILEYLQLNLLSLSKSSLQFNNFGKWPIILWLLKTIILDSLPIWTWYQKEMKDNTLIFPSMFHLHLFDQRWKKYEFLKLSHRFPKLETFRVSSWTSFNPNLNLFGPMIKMDLKYEKYTLELMVYQNFTWSTLTLTDSG